MKLTDRELHTMSKLFYLAEDPFWSIQGEGLRAGQPTIFIRLAGCNATPEFWCWEWCDTKWARSKYNDPVSENEILEQIMCLPQSDWICITGGEPLITDLAPLVTLLKKKGYLIQIETNGTLYQNLSIDHWTVSPKTSCIEEVYWGIAKEIKWIVSEKSDLNRIKMPDFYWGRTFLQPNNNDPEAIKICLDALKEHPDWSLSLQIHKIIGGR